MSDYIQREEVAKVVARYFSENYITDGDWHADGLLREIDDIPAAKVRPVKPYERKIKLLPCTCGRKRLAEAFQCAVGEPDRYAIWCEDCGKQGSFEATNKQARIAWNEMISAEMRGEDKCTE